MMGRACSMGIIWHNTQLFAKWRGYMIKKKVEGLKSTKGTES
jgi:hypothetical protein